MVNRFPFRDVVNKVFVLAKFEFSLTPPGQVSSRLASTETHFRKLIASLVSAMA